MWNNNNPETPGVYLGFHPSWINKTNTKGFRILHFYNHSWHQVGRMEEIDTKKESLVITPCMPPEKWTIPAPREEEAFGMTIREGEEITLKVTEGNLITKRTGVPNGGANVLIAAKFI